MIEFGVLMDVREGGYGGERVDEVVVADELGFDAVWLSEHHLTGDGMLPAPLVMAGVLAARTERIRIGRTFWCCRCTIRCGWPRTRPWSTWCPAGG